MAAKQPDASFYMGEILMGMGGRFRAEDVFPADSPEMGAINDVISDNPAPSEVMIMVCDVRGVCYAKCGMFL